MLACLPVERLTVYIANICGSSTVPFLQFALPGILYFLYLKKLGEPERLQEYYMLKKQKSFSGVRTWIKSFIFGKSFSIIFMMLGFA
jgi:hypothetical protein